MLSRYHDQSTVVGKWSSRKFGFGLGGCCWRVKGREPRRNPLNIQILGYLASRLTRLQKLENTCAALLTSIVLIPCVQCCRSPSLARAVVVCSPLPPNLFFFFLSDQNCHDEVGSFLTSPLVSNPETAPQVWPGYF
jgi:hypothetical protein